MAFYPAPWLTIGFHLHHLALLAEVYCSRNAVLIVMADGKESGGGTSGFTERAFGLNLVLPNSVRPVSDSKKVLENS